MIGTDPKDYGLPRVAVGPKSDGLVFIEHAYVRKAHRAFVYKSHSGTYGEVNSEEGYQNLRRFLFGRWGVRVDLEDLPPYPGPGHPPWPVWQADLRLTIRGLPIVLTEQLAEHWCPIQLNDEIQRLGDAPDHPVPLVGTFLLDPGRPAPARRPAIPGSHAWRADAVHPHLAGIQARPAGRDLPVRRSPRTGPRLGRLAHRGRRPREDGPGLAAWAAWNSAVHGANDQFDPITEGLPEGQRNPMELAREGLRGRIPLPEAARVLPVLGQAAGLAISVTDRTAVQAP